ncbi:MAG: HD-GYP domain-containing protein [Defluviitaleaceae bacterium]|nr:HD-GYP domain-containing protein [Defluviitaleaceae bacterium]
MIETILPSEYLEKGMKALDYVYTPDGVTIVRPGTLLTERMIDFIHQHNIGYVKVEFDEGKYPNAIRVREPRPEKESIFTNIPDIKPVIDDELRDEAIVSIKKMFEAFDTTDFNEKNMTTAHLAVKEIYSVVDKLIETLSDETHSLIHIADLKSYDEYTYHHSLSVAVLAIAIGQSMSFSDEDLRLLGRAAMMHDIGKIYVPNELINKPGKLTESEFRAVKNHTAEGYRHLMFEKVGDEHFRKIVLCHHEKVNGTGYPNKLEGKDIPFMSRIIAVADMYDAVTSYRSYRKPMSPSEAIELVMSEVERALDYNVVKTFVEKMDFYPVNTCVELSDNRLGVVIDNTNSMRPIIRMLDTKEELDLMEMSNLSLVINRVIDSDDYEELAKKKQENS